MIIVKKLPSSWTKTAKKKEPQLSFADVLFNEKTEEDTFIENYFNNAKNLKYLRFRINYSKFPRKVTVPVYAYLSDALDYSARLLYNISKKSANYRLKTLDDYLSDIFINKIDTPLAEQLTPSEIRQHMSNVQAKTIGMFLANKALLKKNKELTEKILFALKASSEILEN